MKLKELIIEKDCLKYPLANKLKEKFAHKTAYSEVDNYEKTSEAKISKIKSTILITKKGGFNIQKMGPDSGNPACDYDIEFIYGCPHHCIYCQQIYSMEETPYIEIYPDIKEVLHKVKNIVSEEKKSPLIFEAGNMTDLLAMEPVTGTLKEIIPFFANELNGKAKLHFLTKSSNVKKILNLKPEGTVRIGFSVNLSEFNKKYELKTSNIEERMEAIKAILKADYKLHISFSPIIYRKGILKDYEKLFEETKNFLLSCEGYNEKELNLEGLIFFQKKGGEKLIKKHYPKISDELMQYFKYIDKGKEKRYCYPENIYNKLLSFLKVSFKNYFPEANILFIS